MSTLILEYLEVSLKRYKFVENKMPGDYSHKHDDIFCFDKEIYFYSVCRYNRYQMSLLQKSIKDTQ